MSSTLSVQLIRDPQGLRVLSAEADALTLTMRPRRPFATNNWLEHWWQNYREQRPLVRDEFYLHVLRDGQGKLIALAPLALTERPSVGPLRARALAFLGSDKNITELRGLVCAPEHEGAAARAWSRTCTSAEHVGWFAWHGVTSTGEDHQYLSSLPNLSGAQVIGYQLQCRQLGKFRTRARANQGSLRKGYNSLKREITPHVRTAEEPLSALLERFCIQARRRCHGPARQPNISRHTPKKSLRLGGQARALPVRVSS